MFSGIVSHSAKVNKMDWTNNQDLSLCFELIQPIPTDLKIGESIAINGACMTITKIEDQLVSIDIMYESLSKTNLSLLKVDDVVNVEFAITLNTRLNGHLVTGHIDQKIELINKYHQGKSIGLEFLVNHDLMKYIIYKGSVAINGVSLTVANVNYQSNTFTVWIIPHTQEITNLLTWPYLFFNLECDYLVKSYLLTQKY